MPKPIMSKRKFISQWLRNFANDITKEDMEKYVKDQYIWHIFSFGLTKRPYLTGAEARFAYDQADKSSCIFCDMFGANGVTDKLLEEYSTAKSMDSQPAEIYVVAKDYSWTYIKTHENDLSGPYFLSNL